VPLFGIHMRGAPWSDGTKHRFHPTSRRGMIGDMDEPQKKATIGAPALSITLGVHVAAVCVCGLFRLLVGSFPQYNSTVDTVISGLLWAALLAWGICPITILTLGLSRGMSGQIKFALVAEALLCILQAFVLLTFLQ
jgi:hypothetical protein